MIDENIYQAVHYLKLLKSPVAGSVHEKYRFSVAIYRTVQRINPIPSNLHEIFAAWVMATSQNSRYASSISTRRKKHNTWNLKAVALTLKSSLPFDRYTTRNWKNWWSDMQNSLTFIVFIFISFVSFNSSQCSLLLNVESNIVPSVYSYNFTNSSNFLSRRSFSILGWME